MDYLSLLVCYAHVLSCIIFTHNYACMHVNELSIQAFHMFTSVCLQVKALPILAQAACFKTRAPR